MKSCCFEYHIQTKGLFVDLKRISIYKEDKKEVSKQERKECWMEMGSILVFASHFSKKDSKGGLICTEPTPQFEVFMQESKKL